jgi:hypothetical protein
MPLRRSIIAVLSLLLCFCLLSKQASANNALDYDLAIQVDVQQAECCTNDEASQPLSLAKDYVYSFVVAIIELPLAEIFYRQPDIPRYLRPPAV